jgi:hypothetical protein
MFKSRLSVLLLLALLLASIAAPAAFAQDETFGLSAEDYERLGSAINQSTAAASSLGFDFTLSLKTGTESSDLMLNGTALVGSNANGPVAQISLTGDNAGESVSLELIVVDNVFYGNDGDGWEGITAEQFLEQFSSISPVPLSPLLSTGPSTQDPAAAQGMMNALAGINAADLVSISNAGANGDTTQFVIDVDLQSFFSSEAFTQLLSSSAAMTGGESAQAQMENMAPMMAMMFQDTSLAINYYIGSDDLINRFAIDFGLGMNPAMMGGGADAEPVNITMTLDVNNFQYGADVSGIAAPEGATMAES